jgi:hypothetical protein
VTRGVADREEDRDLVIAGSREGVIVPGLPVDRIVSVLLEIGARGSVQAIAFRGAGH